MLGNCWNGTVFSEYLRSSSLILFWKYSQHGRTLSLELSINCLVNLVLIKCNLRQLYQTNQSFGIWDRLRCPCLKGWLSHLLVLFPWISSFISLGFPSGSRGEDSASRARDPGSVSEWGRSPGEGNGNLLQYSCLENSMDSEAWRTTVPGVAKSQTWLSD